MLYRSTDRVCRSGAAVKNLAHSASSHSCEKTVPSKPEIKHVRSHPWIGVVFMRQRENRDKGPAMLLIVEKLSPVIVPQRHTTHESLRPVVGPSEALLKKR
jgi:hypothetical protein